ncbi:MAG: response regulator, partial [Bacteroidales bacterium]
IIMYINNQNNDNFRNKLLIIDDDPETRLLIKIIMRDTRITVIEAVCGIEALDLFIKFSQTIFLVILDIRLPVCDGWTLICKFRKINPQVPVITVSAIFPQELALKSKLAGVEGYISKPFRLNELRQIIASYYENSFKKYVD